MSELCHNGRVNQASRKVFEVVLINNYIQTEGAVKYEKLTNGS